MPIMNGFAAAARIRSGLPGTKIIFLTMHTGAAYIHRALECGAYAYVLKSAAAEELCVAMESAAAGRHYLSSELTPRGVGRTMAGPVLSLGKPCIYQV